MLELGEVILDMEHQVLQQPLQMYILVLKFGISLFEISLEH